MKKIKYTYRLIFGFIRSLWRQFTMKRIVLATIKGYSESAKVKGTFILANPFQAKRYKQKVGTKMAYVKWDKYHNGETMVVPFASIQKVDIKYIKK